MTGLHNGNNATAGSSGCEKYIVSVPCSEK